MRADTFARSQPGRPDMPRADREAALEQERLAAGLAVNPEKLNNNVIGGPLELCSSEPVTGFFRNGFCTTGPQDRGKHLVCAEMTQEFLEFTKARGNDLSTPRGKFPGLQPGQRWCLCVLRWAQAERAGVAPAVYLEATHEFALRALDADTLASHALTRHQ